MSAELIRIPFAEYCKREGLNNSSLKHMDISPKHYHARDLRPHKDTAATKIGRPIHTAVLEPELFDSGVTVWKGGHTKDGKPTTSKNSTEYKSIAALAAMSGKEILDAKQVAICHRVAEAVSLHDDASRILSGGQAEMSIFWDHPLGFKCKSRIDYLRPDLFADLKSAVDITPEGFGRAAHKFGYVRQGAFYQDAVRAATGLLLPFYIVAVEKCEPFDVAVYEVPDELLGQGRNQYQDHLVQILRCTESGIWPGVCPTTQTLELPAWAYNELDDATIVIDGERIAV